MISEALKINRTLTSLNLHRDRIIDIKEMKQEKEEKFDEQ